MRSQLEFHDKLYDLKYKSTIVSTCTEILCSGQLKFQVSGI